MTEEQASRQRWFTHLKSFASSQGELHPYGSEPWCALPDRSWRKIAAAAAAGECWARDGDNLEQRVRDELYFLHETWHDEVDGCVIPYNPHLRQPDVTKLVARAEGAARVLWGEREAREVRYAAMQRPGWRDDELRRMT